MPRLPGPGKDGAALQVRAQHLSRRELLPPIPIEAAKDPEKWAEEHLRSLRPDAAKEVEYALKFGSDQLRYQASKDLLGLNAKDKSQEPPKTMVFIHNGPVTPKGTPIMPWSNAEAALDSGKTPVTVDITPVAMDATED